MWPAIQSCCWRPPGRKLEDALDQKTAELIALRRAAMEHPSKAAVHDATLDRAAEGVRSRTGSAGGADWEIPASMGSNASAAAQGELGAGAAAAGLFVGPQPVVLTPDSEYGGSEASSPLARAGKHGGSDFGGAMGAGLGSGGAGPVDGLALQVEELRLHHGRELAEREAHWRSQCDALQSRLDAAQAAAAQQQQQRRQQQAAGAGGASSAALAAQCDALGKEREALRTILDNKVGAGQARTSLASVQVPPQLQYHLADECLLPCRAPRLPRSVPLTLPTCIPNRSACWWTTLGAAWRSCPSRWEAALLQQHLRGAPFSLRGSCASLPAWQACPPCCSYRAPTARPTPLCCMPHALLLHPAFFLRRPRRIPSSASSSSTWASWCEPQCRPWRRSSPAARCTSAARPHAATCPAAPA